MSPSISHAEKAQAARSAGPGTSPSPSTPRSTFSTVPDDDDEKRSSSPPSTKTSDALPVVDYTPEDERRVVRKVDLFLMPGLTFLYLLSFLDRSNVGNAKGAGMLKDIGLAHKPEVYNTALALYFLGYVLFEIPANMV
ncbi:hypothetical protein JCM10212_006858, partial [Sporobolomyces blumeae]